MTLSTTVNKVIRRLKTLPDANLQIRDPLDAACHRLDKKGLLHRYRNNYFPRRNEMIAAVLKEIQTTGQWNEATVDTPLFSKCDERVVEYPFVANEIVQHTKSGKIDVADVGCVLNNPLMAEILKGRVNWTWFFNASIEPPSIRGNVAYLEADIRQTDIYERLQFPLVTCLSTLEHIGMDNTRYGGTRQEFDSPPADPEKFAIQGLETVAKFVRPGGTLIVSVPYGPFEYVQSAYDPGPVIYYVFDRPRIEAMMNSLKEFQVEPHLFKVVPGKGWVRTDLSDSSLLRLGHGISSSGGVAILKGIKRS